MLYQHPQIAKIKETRRRNDCIHNVIRLGTPGCPLPVTYYKNGQKYEKAATGHKFSLLEVREKLLTKHVYLMRLCPNNEINKLLSNVAPGTISDF